jgi:hypothetical protein
MTQMNLEIGNGVLVALFLFPQWPGASQVITERFSASERYPKLDDKPETTLEDTLFA